MLNCLVRWCVHWFLSVFWSLIYIMVSSYLLFRHDTPQGHLNILYVWDFIMLVLAMIKVYIVRQVILFYISHCSSKSQWEFRAIFVPRWICSFSKYLLIDFCQKSMKSCHLEWQKTWDIIYIISFIKEFAWRKET